MTTRLITVALLAGAAGAMGAAELPASLPMARYEKMLHKSPFALATAAEPAVAATAPFAANLYVSGIAKIGDGDLVTVRSRDQTQSFSLTAKDQGPDGITLVSVQWNDQVGKSKVTVKKGAESAVIEFDQATLQKVVAPIPMSHSGNGPHHIALPPGAATTVAPPPQNFPQVSGPLPVQQGNGGQPGEGRSSGFRRRIIPSRPTQ